MGKQVKKNVLNIVTWLTGVIVSLTVGFAMIGQTLTIPIIPAIIIVVAGWIVVLTTILSAILAILKK